MIPEEIEDIESIKSIPPKIEDHHPQYLGKIDKIINEWNKKMVHFDKQHFEIKINKTKIDKKKIYNLPLPSSRPQSIIDDYNSSQNFTAMRGNESPMTPTDKLLDSISIGPSEEISKKQILYFAKNINQKRDTSEDKTYKKINKPNN
jgi:hypothetical protein